MSGSSWYPRSSYNSPYSSYSSFGSPYYGQSSFNQPYYGQSYPYSTTYPTNPPNLNQSKVSTDKEDPPPIPPRPSMSRYQKFLHYLQIICQFLSHLNYTLWEISLVTASILRLMDLIKNRRPL